MTIDNMLVPARWGFYRNGRLDRKSSRGMIFENEELRLRTININAEVERGQTDIKRLRRENEQLRREIWTLRDECDRLNKRFKAKILDQEHGGCSARGSGGSSACTRCPSQSNSDDSDSCDTCKGDDDQCSDDCCQIPAKPVKQNVTPDNIKPNNSANDVYPKFIEPQNLHNTFDHLSVVSEETLSNSEIQQATAQSKNDQQQADGHAFKPNVNGSQITFPSLMGPITPLTPIELVANQLNDLQAVVPPLSYFENILQEHMGSTIGMTPDTACITPSSKIVKHTNGWDYNLQSPFAQRKPSITSSTSSPSSASTRSPTVKQRYPPAQSTLTTFVPTPQTPPLSTVDADSVKNPANTASFESTANTHTNESPARVPIIETVAITTMPTTAPAPPPTSLGSPKHFFSPLKPRLKINTSLANKNATIPAPPVVPTSSATETNATIEGTKEHQNCDPPDIYVSNALASPYKPPQMPSQSPQLPQRNTNSVATSHVSFRHCHHHHYCHQHQHQHQHHILGHQQQQQKRPRNLEGNETTTLADVTNRDFDVDTDGDTVDDENTAASNNAKAISASTDTESIILTGTIETVNETIPLSTEISKTLLPVEQCIVCFSKPNEPIYAIAQERRHKLISAPVFTKPLMTAIATIKSSNTNTNTSVSAFNYIFGDQTESVNLETILNDIEHISEDILAIQLEKNKSRENPNGNSSAQNSKPLQGEDKNKKPYRSEMNLLLSYDGTNQTITPALMANANQEVIGENSTRTRTRSLERETTESPSPKIPDAMPTFPDNRTYTGFEKLNKAATPSTPQKLKPPPHSLGGGSKSATSSPKKPPPPAPPSRMNPPPLNIRCAGIARSSPLINSTPTTPQITNGEPHFTPQGLVPNKSHLYKAIANAAARRGQFIMASPTLSRSLDLELADPQDTSKTAGLNTNINEISSDPEVAKRKARRVSIVCGESPSTPDVSPVVNASSQIVPPTTPTNQLSTGSCTNLTATPTNPLLQTLKQVTSHSTPNSPHSVRRRNVSASSTDDFMRNSHYQHQHQRSNNSSTPSQHRRSSQDSVRGNTQDTVTASANPNVTRSKCSRRHSDGTVASNVRVSGTSGHHHHHHHHHQHSSSTVGNAHPHHSHHSHQDSNQETGSVSDRNSNSFASSRDSSTSFSMRSQRRKISVSSHTGGKIPWCGCWGNGCL